MKSPNELIKDLASNAQLSASCNNNQPWRFVFVYDPEMLLKMRKKGKLSSEELGEMVRHTKYGAEILNHFRHLSEVALGVKAHHERFDGTGYPDKLSGEDIPLIARIIAVADSFDAMTSDRPYRKAIDIEKAFEELRCNVGTQFDRKVVEAFMRT